MASPIVACQSLAAGEAEATSLAMTPQDLMADALSIVYSFLDASDLRATRPWTTCKHWHTASMKVRVVRDLIQAGLYDDCVKRSLRRMMHTPLATTMFYRDHIQHQLVQTHRDHAQHRLDQLLRSIVQSHRRDQAEREVVASSTAPVPRSTETVSMPWMSSAFLHLQSLFDG